MLFRLAILLLAAFPLLAANPESVTVAGSLQTELGCPYDWMPDCNDSFLLLDAEDDVWQETLDLPAGSWEYKAAIDSSWTESYGAGAQRNGANIPLALAAPEAVKFYYDHKSHWITDNVNSVIVTASGSFQSELGCAGGDWQPGCLRSWLQDPDGDGTYTLLVQLPAGNYEVKATIDESWTENYGAGGVQNGANIPFTVSADCQKTLFSYVASTHVLSAGPAPAAAQPVSVTIPASFQPAVGCSGVWQPECANTHLTYDAGDTVWQGAFNIPAGSWEYKVAIDDSWAENYGANAAPNGANIPLTLAGGTAVRFYYDHATHWVADHRTKVIATAAGSFQSVLGCPGDWQPDCLRSWLQDPDGDGIYTFSTSSLPAGNYEVKVAIDESWSENYGANGARDGANIPFTVPSACSEMLFRYDASSHVLTITTPGGPKGNLAHAQAWWVASDLIAWDAPQPASEVALHASATGDLELTPSGVTGGTTVALSYDAAGLPAAVREKFPHLAGMRAWRVPAQTDVATILKGQIAVSSRNQGGEPEDATALQIAGVLDDLYSCDTPLGVVWSAGVPTIRVWAPTARNVTLRRFANAKDAAFTEQAMTRDANGVWSVTGDASWTDQFYLYDVEVFVRSTGAIEHNVVTDPYSHSLARNSTRTQIVDLTSPALKPAGWDSLVKPPLAAPEDIALYELHVRDFSASDERVPAALRGTFKAFTQARSSGMEHLAALAASGLTHVQLLPSFDFSSVGELKSLWADPGDLTVYPPDGHQQQAAIAAIRDKDAFNWGYEPWHFTVPEGSYSTNPDGTARIVEFREMVQALSEAGLRIVMDVVYSHTGAAGQNDHSVLDRIVPGYYHRLDADGNIETSTGGANTASEHDMMERLLIDSVLTWATQYKVDGFRFDLMGHHMKRNLVKLRAALDALGPEGRAVYLYGEGWNFGEVANNARGVQATQANMAGTGIGTLNDRMRDGVRGGTPQAGTQAQGFATGLYVDPNATDQGTPADQKNVLLHRTDWIRSGLAGALQNFTLVDRLGNDVTASQIDYEGQPAGYTADPQEAVQYVESHDNATLFDAMQLKLPVVTTMAQRVRAQNLALSIVALGQGIPFFHAGGELLRSKSLDRNSYDSGDWFNRLDFTYETNNWGAGLPPAAENQSDWPIFAPLLADADLRAGADDIAGTLAVFHELLAIRRSTPLFRLRTAADVRTRVTLFNGGPKPVPGMVVMAIADGDGAIDRRHDLVAVAFNASPTPQTYTAASLASKKLLLHPILAQSQDAVVRTASCGSGTFTIPGRTTAVFWSVRPLTEQVDLLMNDVTEPGLRATLAAARDAILRGQPKTAQKQLQAFIKQVQALKPPNAAQLIAEANAILAQL